MSRAQLNYSLRRNKTATRGSGATNQLRDAAAEKFINKIKLDFVLFVEFQEEKV